MNSKNLQFHQEANFFTIANPHISLRFSTIPPGSLAAFSSEPLGISLFHIPLAVATAETWRIEFPPSQELPPLGSRSAAEFTHNFSQDDSGAGRLEMEWSRLTWPGGELAIRVGITFLLPADSHLCFCRARLHLPAEVNPASLTFLFPNFSGLQPPEPDTSGLFLPLAEGMLITNPAASLSAAQWLYPAELTMQFAGLQIPSHDASLYLAAHDGGGCLKGMRAGPDERGHLHLSLLNFPSSKQDSSGDLRIEYDLAFGLLPGGWPEAARTYRSWAQSQSFCPAAQKKEPPPRDKQPLPPKKEESDSFEEGRYRGLWLLASGSSEEIAAAATTLQRETNTPVRLLWQWWHNCPGDSLYPDYFPPRDGEGTFSRVLSQLKEAGIPAFPVLNTAAASPRSYAWEAMKLKEQASLGPAGNLQEMEANPFSDDTLAAVCPAAGEWLSLLAAICLRLRRLGAEGVWLQRVFAGGEGLRCFSAEHSHPPGGGSHFGEALAAFSCPAVASNPAEIYFPKLLAAVLPGPSREREGRPRGLRTDNWEPIPLLQAVYSPHLRSIGLIGPLNNLFPYDPKWPVSQARPKAVEASLLREEHLLQFTLEAARTLLWGYQAAFSGFDPLLLREYSSRRKLAFLHSLLQIDALEPVETRGEFLGPILADCGPLEADFLVNSLYSRPGQRRSYTRLLPAVLITAWRSAPGKLSLVAVCLQERETQFSCELPLSRFKVASSGKVSVLTFSPEMAGKSARLSLTGNTLSGRLPPRSASIVWL
jgi:hypothetical protein